MGAQISQVVNPVKRQGVPKGVDRDSQSSIGAQEAQPQQYFVANFEVDQVHHHVSRQVTVVGQVEAQLQEADVVNVPPDKVHRHKQTHKVKVDAFRVSAHEVGVEDDERNAVDEAELVYFPLKRCCLGR